MFGHGTLLGALQGTQAEQALVPIANMTLREVPDGVSDDVALFAGDVMGTGYHAVVEGGVKPGDSVAVLGLGPVGLCAVQVALAAGAGPVFAIDTVEARLEVARAFGATRPPDRAEPRDEVREATDEPRRRRRDRRRRPSRRAGSGDPPGAQGRHRGRDRRAMPSPARCTWASCGSRR